MTTLDRREVQALTLLNRQKQQFQQVPSPKDFHDNYEQCKDKVSQTLTGTQTCMKTVCTYAQDIHTELDSIRKSAKDFNIQMSEYLKNNLPKMVNAVYGGGGSTRPLQRSDINIREAKRVHELELLMKQTQELNQLILNTESFIDKVETEGEISLQDFLLIQGSLDRWTNSLETEKEREQRQKEEAERIEREKQRKLEEERGRKEREEAERKRQEEEERKRIEEEKRRQEEEKRRQEEAKLRQNPDNWKPMVYYRNDGKSSYHKGIICAVKAMEGVISQTDLSCSASDSNKDLDGCLRGDEKLASSMIDIILLRSTGNKFELPIQVFIPCCVQDDSYEVTVKMSTGSNWRYQTILPKHTFKETPNVVYVGIELPSLQHVKLVVVSRHKRDKIMVDKNGKTYESDVDRNMKVVFPPDTFNKSTNVSMKVLPLKKYYVQSAKKFHKQLLGGVQTSSSLYEISCEEETEHDILMELYGQGSDDNGDIYVGSKKMNQRPTKPKAKIVKDSENDEHKNENQTDQEGDGDIKLDQEELIEDKEVGQEDEDSNYGSDSMDDEYWNAIKRCEPELVTRMQINDVLNYLKRSDTLSLSQGKLEIITAHKTRGDQVREFIKQLSFLGVHAFDAFSDSLKKTNQKDLADLIDNKLKDEKSKDKTSTVTRSNLHVVYRQGDGGPWCVMDKVDFIEDSGGVVVKLPSKNKLYEVLALTSSPSMTSDEVCKAAESLTNHTNETKVTIICKQKADNLHDTYIHCVRSTSVKSRVMELHSIGYTEGPPESPEFCLLDGDEINLDFDVNIKFNSWLGDKPTLKFYSNMDSARLSGNLEPVDEKAQSKNAMFHGNLIYSIGNRPKMLPYAGSLVVYLPKPKWSSDRPYFAPLTLNVPMQAVSKLIALRFTEDTLIKDRWKDFIANLEKKEDTLRKIQTRVNKQYKDESEKVKKENFILNWAKERPVAEDKVGSVINALQFTGNRSLLTEAREVASFYKDGDLRDTLPSSTWVSAEWVQILTASLELSNTFKQFNSTNYMAAWYIYPVDSERILSDSSLKEIAVEVEDQWETLAINLSVSAEDTQRIKIDYQQSQARALVMLDIWRLSDKAIGQGKDSVKFLTQACKSANCSRSLNLKLKKYQ